MKNDLMIDWDSVGWGDVYWFALRRNPKYKSSYDSFVYHAGKVHDNSSYKFDRKYKYDGMLCYRPFKLSKKPSQQELEDKLFYDDIFNVFVAKWLIPPTDYKRHYPCPPILPPPITFKNFESIIIAEEQEIRLNLANELYLPSYDMRKLAQNIKEIANKGWFRKHTQLDKDAERGREGLNKDNILLWIMVKEYVERLPVDRSRKPRGPSRKDTKTTTQYLWPENFLNVYETMIKKVHGNKSPTHTNLLKDLEKAEGLLHEPYLIIYAMSKAKELPNSFYEYRNF